MIFPSLTLYPSESLYPEAPSWITPVTNRVSGSRTTANDMNRIMGNANIVAGVDIGRTDYTSNDIVTEAEWGALIDFVQAYDDTITESTHYSNLNNIESVLKRLGSYHFTLGGKTLYYRQGQTWGDWLDSVFNYEDVTNGMVMPAEYEQQGFEFYSNLRPIQALTTNIGIIHKTGLVQFVYNGSTLIHPTTTIYNRNYNIGSV